jgi:hypothetical protein
VKAGQAVHLHIGAMKTGTTYLQRLLEANGDALAADGARFAGATWVDQVRGVRDVLDMGDTAEAKAKFSGAWDELLEDMDGSHLRPIISMEFLSYARAPAAARVVQSLLPADVHVVLSIRTAARVVPAQWQEQVQNRSTVSWEQWCAQVPVASTPPTAARRIAQRAVAVSRMVRAWAPVVAAERLHVVTVPPPGSPPTVLWGRFAQALDLTADRYVAPEGKANASLGHVSAELLRRLNERLVDLDIRRYNTVVKAVLAKDVLAGMPGDRPVRLVPSLVGCARRWDEQTLAAIRNTPCDLIGDLADLQDPVPVDSEPVVVTAEQLLAAGRRGITGLRARLATDGAPVPERPPPADVEAALTQLAEVVQLSGEHGSPPRPAAPTA